MGKFFDFFDVHFRGIVGFLLVVVALLLIVRSLLTTFGVGVGRAAPRNAAPAHTTVGSAVIKFFVEIINDFRHLLALVIVLVFAVTLYAVIRAGWEKDGMDGIKEGIQVVAASLGGLIGSIIGYYFGESAAQKAAPRAGDAPGPAGLPADPRPIVPPPPIVDAKPPPAG